MFTSPVNARSPSPAERRYVRGSVNGSGPRKCRRLYLISSFDWWPDGSYGGSRSSRWLRPFSSTITDHPAAVSTSATVDPPGPDPTITASQSRSAMRTHPRLLPLRHLDVRVAARLDVAGEVDRLPCRAVAVAAVDGIAVERLARVRVEEVLEVGVGVEPPVLLLAVRVGEVRAQRREAGAVLRLQADNRPVELALGQPLRSLDACAPRELLDGAERQPL